MPKVLTRTARKDYPEAGMAVEALFDNLLTRNPNKWVAVRVQDAEHWEVVQPRSQEAIAFAVETDEHAIIERMADKLTSVCDDDLERAFILARDCLKAAVR